MEAGIIIRVLAVDDAKAWKRTKPCGGIDDVDIGSGKLMIPVAAQIAGVENKSSGKFLLDLESPLVHGRVLTGSLLRARSGILNDRLRKQRFSRETKTRESHAV